MKKYAALIEYMLRSKAIPEEIPDYDTDNRPKGLEPGIYQGSRRVFFDKPLLKDFFPGEHGFLFMVPENPERFKKYIRDINGTKGILVSGYNDPAAKDPIGKILNRKLTAGINRSRDIGAIRLLLSNKRDNKVLDTKLYDVSDNLEDSLDDTIENVITLANNYKKNTKRNLYPYITFPRESTHGANCLGFVEAVGQLAGIEDRVLNYSGFDPGLTKTPPKELFLPSEKTKK